MTFASLGLSVPLLRAVSDLDYEVPTAVQRAAIPIILRGGDVWASAETGSGKTAAYLLPILERLHGALDGVSPTSPRRVRALVVVPTRELAAQIGDVVASLGRHLDPKLVTRVAVGGVSINPQMMALRGGADIVVATPGRLLDLVAQNALGLSSVEILVLDEADRLFALGFADELARVLALLPGRRQRLLFSATFPMAVRALVDSLLHEPTRIDVDHGQIPPGTVLVQRAITVDPAKRTLLLRELLRMHAWPRVLVFVASRYRAEHVTQKLQRGGILAACLHGELSQGARTEALADFKATRVQILVATDVLARGLDVVQLPAVVNYDLPRSTVEYLHRVGRTGRAAGPGIAISFVSPETEAHFRLIEKKHKLTIARERIEGFEPQDVALPATSVTPIVPALDPTGGIKGRRKSKKDKLREAAARARDPEANRDPKSG